MLAECRKQLGILHVPNRLRRRTKREIRQIRDKLSEANVRRQFADLSEQSQDFLAFAADHESKSLFVSCSPKSGLFAVIHQGYAGDRAESAEHTPVPGERVELIRSWRIAFCLRIECDVLRVLDDDAVAVFQSQ